MAKIRDFQTITNEEVEKILRISSSAKQAAMEEMPKSNSNSLDETERNIITFCNRKVREANDLVYDKFSVFKQLMTKVSEAISKIDSLKYMHENFKNTYKYKINQSVQETEIKKKEVELSKKDLFSFKAEHKIIRQEKSSTKPLLNWAIVFAIVFAESILNASFFAQGNDLGLVGGIVQAFIIVMINVLIANLVVLLIRRRNLVTNTPIVTLGYTALSGVLVLGLISFHFLVGHYRDSLSTFPEDAYRISVQAFSEHPYILDAFESYILVIMGFLFFIILVIDMYKLKDPYPGYGEITVKYNKVKNEYDDLIFALLEEEKELNDELDKKIETIEMEVKNIFEEVQGIHISKQKLENKYKEHVEYLKILASSSIQTYRSMNNDMRTTPKPEYFNEPIEFNPELIEFIYTEDKEKTVMLESAILRLPENKLLAKNLIEDVKTNIKAEVLEDIS